MALMIGITGTIGSGKSVVSRILRTEGFFVYDCDWQARMITDNSVEIKNTIRHRFGNDAFNEEGILNRKLIAAKIFEDDSERHWLNKLIHSAVFEEVERLKASTDDIIFVESAILVSSGLVSLCDAVLRVEADRETCIDRTCIRDRLNRKDVKARLDVQESEHAALSGFSPLFIINNDGTMSLLEQIGNITEEIKQQLKI